MERQGLPSPQIFRRVSSRTAPTAFRPAASGLDFCINALVLLLQVLEKNFEA
jgi:hypothetical protein